MIALGYYRIWMGIVPLIFSLQFVWKAHEHALLQTSGNRTLDEDKLDSANSENITSAEVLLENKDVISKKKTSLVNENNPEPVVKSSLSEFMDEAREFGKLIFENFGLTRKLALLSLDTSNGEPGDKLNGGFRNFSLETLFGSLEFKSLLSSTFLNIVAVMTFWYIRPVILACCSCTRRRMSTLFLHGCSLPVLLAKGLVHLVLRPIRKSSSKVADKRETELSTQQSDNSSINIKDPESIASSMVTVDNQSESSYESFQTSVEDEKRTGNGPEERGENGVHEWLEDSLIEGGIQTFRSFENDDNRCVNNTNNYLQVSQAGSSDESRISEFKATDNFKTSTPDNSAVSNIIASNWSDETGVYTPVNLKRYLHDRYNKTKELGLSFEKNMDESYISAVDEQKKREPIFEWRLTDQIPSRLEDFVNATKNRIRNKTINMSYV